MTLKKLLSLLIISTFLSAFAVDAAAQTRKRRVPPPRKYTVTVRAPALVTRNPEQQRRFDSFMKVWLTINENYFDSTFGGLDWNKVREDYTVKVDKAATDAEFHDILQELISRLNKSHFTIVPPEVFKAIDIAKIAARAKDKADREANEDEAEDDDEDTSALDDMMFDENAKYGTGIEMRLMADQFVVTRVREGSSAGKAGIRPGYVIEKVNGFPLNEVLKKVEAKYARSKSIKKLLGAEIVRWMLNGEKDSEVMLAYLNEKDEVKESTLLREKLSGETVSIGHNYPEQYLNFETRSLNDQTGYLSFDVFAMPIIEKFCSALTTFKDKKALIVDLRGNHGGLFSALMGVTGMLTDKSMDIGTQIYKVGSEKVFASNVKKNFKGRLVFLVDESSLSSAEIMAAAMQEGGRATIVGERTGGEALPAYSQALPTGAVFIYPAANFKTPKGNYIEGIGVAPDITVAIDRKTLLTGKDVQLEAALKAAGEPMKAPVSAPERFTVIGNAAPPPPPLPAAKPGVPPPSGVGGPPPRILAAVKPPAPEPLPPVNDTKSLELIEEFLKKLGGRDAIKKVVSYSMKGLVDVEMRGMTNRSTVAYYRGGPNKYAEIMSDDALGEVREIFTKDSYDIFTDFGYTTSIQVGEMDRIRDVLRPIFQMADADTFKSLEYSGIFDREGRKTHVITAAGKLGEEIALGFDVETGMLVGYAGPSVTLSFGDYRKVGDIQVPHRVERGGIIKIDFFDVTVNTPIDEANFTKKINCFDKLD